MKKLESVLGMAAGLAFGSTALLAANALGTLVFKGVAGHAPEAEVAPAEGAVPQPATETPAAATATAPAATPAPAAVAPEPAAAEAVDVAAGEAVFKKCKACHTAEAGAKNGTGPNLWSVVGRPVASVEGFAYSDAMTAEAGKVWDAAFLDAYLTKPKDAIPGNKMSFAGLKEAADRHNLIAWLASRSDTPLSPAELGFAAAAAGVPAATAEPAAADAAAPDAAAADAVAAGTPVAIEPVPYPEGVTYADPAEPTEAERAEIAARVATLEAEIPTLDYQRARYHPLHFSPAIDTASNEECLTCHQETLTHTPRAASPAGVPAEATIAWYQTLDTYSGPQADFHWRHLESDFAKQVMKLDCVFCHKGNDPREESPDMLPTRAALSAPAVPEFTLRKMVNPSTTCLRCHGAMPGPEAIMGLAGAWHEIRGDMEFPEAPNGCLSCHAETFRTVRHTVDYLKAASIEAVAREGSSDTCYGCHGGRAWYRISYPYPRHAWPGMDEAVPDWAATRPTESDPEYALPRAAE